MKDLPLVKWEVHAHTCQSSNCGVISAKELVDGVFAHGYQGLVITDHYDPERFLQAKSAKAYREKVMEQFDGYHRAAEQGARLGLQVLPGIELRLTAGNEDYLLYGINQEITLDIGNIVDLPLKKVRSILQPLGVLIIQAHPYRKNQYVADPHLLDGVEVFNGNPRHDSHNERALAFAMQNDLLMTRGSDIHQSTDFASAHLLMPLVKNERDLVSAMRQYAKGQ